MKTEMPWWRVDFGEAAARAAFDAVEGRFMTLGPITRQFEERMAYLLGVPHVIATSSGTAALTLALLEAGIGPGDEVIVPDRTWIATAHAVLLLGATPVFADVEADRPVLDVEAFKAAAGPRTRAVLPVHLNGRAVDMPALRREAEQRGILVIEDACQALFSRSQEGGYLGCHSRCGCFSLSIGKAISSGQGGFVTTHDGEIARRLVMARTHGTSDITMAHWEMPGGNFRMWDLPAAIALTQLDLLEKRTADLHRVYQRYQQALRRFAFLELLPVRTELGELPLYVECMSRERARIVEHLAAAGIQARPYYANLDTAPQFSRRAGVSYARSQKYADECFVLPCGPDRGDDEIDRVIEVLSTFPGSDEA